MKKFTWVLFAFFLVPTITLLTSCSKDDDEQPTTNTDPSFTAKINVSDLISPIFTHSNFVVDFSQPINISAEDDLLEEGIDLMGAAAQISADTLGIYAYQIVGTDTNNVVLQTLLTDTKVGVYEMNLDNVFAQLFSGEEVENIAGGIYTSTALPEESIFLVFFAALKENSQIEITEYDEVNQTISGTFNFAYLGEDDNGNIVEAINVSEGKFENIPIL